MNPPPDSSLPPEALEAAAACWLSLRDRGMSPEETAAFLRWLQQDPRHGEVFAELELTWRQFDRLAAVPAPVARHDPDLLRPRPRRRRPFGIRWALAGAAAALAVAGLAVLAPRPARPVTETEVGAFRRFDLPDGSVAQLNTDSALEVAFAPAERRVRVVRGEVFFAVAKDPSRPFLVEAGPVTVRAVGTAFNVRHRADAVEVLVTEGRVAVGSAGAADAPAAGAPRAAELAAGDRATVAIIAGRAAPGAPAVEQVAASARQRALAWQERRLEFDDVPLAEVVREFNRYNPRQLVIADSVLGGRRFSGVFRTDGQEPFVRLLESGFGVRAEVRDREILLHVNR
ncbi:MAG: FecR domain-containing protein [Verrucomicrobia bacterium]|nr:FecR domain-containing protein [Verrucomicrobiota bacterium]